MTRDWHTELARTWGVLRTPRRGVEAAVLPAPTGRDPLRLGLDPAGARHLFVPTSDDIQPAPNESSISLRQCELVFDEGPERYLDIGCDRPALFDIFDELLALLIPELISSDDPAAAAMTAIDRWRELLRAYGPSRLTTERQIGLFAELWCLRELAQDGRLSSANQWRGPLREPHDLHLGTEWIEVKGVGPSSTHVTIHGLEQLDADAGLPGSLAVVEVIEDEDGESLPELATSVLGSGLVLPTEQLEDLLLTSGALGAGSDRRWTVTDLLLVDAGKCPRLVPAMLSGGAPEGVTRVEYDVDRQLIDALGVRGLGALRSPGRPS